VGAVYGKPPSAIRTPKGVSDLKVAAWGGIRVLLARDSYLSGLHIPLVRISGCAWRAVLVVAVLTAVAHENTFAVHMPVVSVPTRAFRIRISWGPVYPDHRLTVDFSWLVPSSIYYTEEISKNPNDVAVEKAKWPQNRGSCAHQRRYVVFVQTLQVYLGRTLHSRHHAGGVARPRYTEAATIGCGWPPFPSISLTPSGASYGLLHVSDPKPLVLKRILLFERISPSRPYTSRWHATCTISVTKHTNIEYDPRSDP
jgi:hypothetical protein